jgi:hypothetical protein
VRGVFVLGLALLASAASQAQCFQDQIDMDFTFQTLDRLIPGLMTSWNTIWTQVTYQQGPSFGGADNDGNGIKDDDNFDMLAAVYNGDASVVANLNPSTVSTVRSAFDANEAKTQTIEISLKSIHAEAYNGLVSVNLDVTTGSPASVLGQSFDVPSLWNGDKSLMNSLGPELKKALLDLISCYMTVGDTTSVAHLQSLLRVVMEQLIQELVPKLLASSGGSVTIKEYTFNPSTKDLYVQVCGIQTVDCVKVWVKGSEIDNTVNNYANSFNCGAFSCQPTILGTGGDLNGDGQTNLTSYQAAANRQQFLTNESIVNPPMQIVTQPVSVTAESGDEVHMSTSILGGLPGGDRSYKWESIDSSKFTSTGLLSTNETYDIAYALPTAADGVLLTMTACDSLWTRRSAPATLTVNYAPFTIATQPVGGNPIVDSDFVLTVGAHGGAALPTYQWRKDTVNISGIGASLGFLPVQLSDTGSYTCVVSSQDSAGAAVSVESNPAVINVVDRIRFSEHPANGGVYVGESFSFHAAAIGAVVGTMHYKWQKQTGSDWADLPNSDAADYTFATATLADNGVYRCVIFDDVYTIPSNSALFVVVEHLSFTQIPADSVAFQDGRFNFTVAVNGGLGALHYQWIKDSNPVGDDASTLHLQPVSTTDEGYYAVTVSDSRENITSAPPAYLHVAPPFGFASQPVGGNKYTGDTHTFSLVTSDGVPPFTYVWKKNDAPIPGAPNGTSYTIPVLSPSDSGVYTCTAFDQNGGNTTDPVTLQVADHMSFAAQPVSGQAYLGDSYTFSVAMNGGLKPLTYSWFKKDSGGDTDLNAHGPSYTVSTVNATTSGAYYCRVSDLFESVSSRLGTVGGVTPLTFSQQPAVGYRIAGGDYQFSVQASGGLGDIHYQWYHDTTAVGEDSATLTLTSLTVLDQGDYSCKATDQIKTTASDKAKLTVYPVLPSKGDKVRVNLDASQVVPVAISVATGFGFGSLRASTTSPGNFQLSMTVTHQVSAPTDATLNWGLPGDNGPLMFDLGQGISAFAISKTLTNQQAAELIAGFDYLQIASTIFPAGEIRGQLLADPMVYITPDTTSVEMGQQVQMTAHSTSAADTSFTWTVDGGGTLSVSNTGMVTGVQVGNGYVFAVGKVSNQQGQASVTVTVPVEGEGAEGEGEGEGAEGEGEGEGAEGEGEGEGAATEGEGAAEGEGEGEGEGAAIEGEGQALSPYHSADENADNLIDLSELLRVIQFFNIGGYHCLAGSEDGYAPGLGDTNCTPHDSDYNPQDWKISLSELLRVIQFFNTGGYHRCPGLNTEDGFCPGKS